jgi:hypothetical protein
LTLSFGHAYKGFEDKLMSDAFLPHRDKTADRIPRPDSSSDRTSRALRLAGWFVLPALLLLAAGCGGGSSKKQIADSGQAQEEEKAAPVAEEEAAPVVRKRGKLKVAEKPATPEPPVRSNKDVAKWDMADLNAALVRRDLLFLPAVVLFSARNPDDSKRAEDLDALLRRVAKLKDDPTIPLAMPSSAVAASGSPSAAAPAQPAVAAPATKVKWEFHIGVGKGK